MTWLRRYQIRNFLRTAFWPAPVVSMIVAMFVVRILRVIDIRYGWAVMDFTPDGARAILSAFVSAMLTFLVFVMSSLLLLVQLASAQLTPRIIAPVFQRRAIRVALSLFIFAYVLSLGALGRTENVVPQFFVAVTVAANLASIFAFLYFIGVIGLSLRPVVVVSTLADVSRNLIQEIYPHAYDPDADVRQFEPTGEPTCIVLHSGTSGVLLAFDVSGLVNMAARCGSVLQLVPRVGDYVANGDPLFNAYGGTAPDPLLIHSSVAVGPERTLEQDPAFAFRVLVDIACRALSPAINDPTTAVLALDQIHRLLRRVGTRRLDAGIYSDASGQVRLVCRTPGWGDFVHLGAAEIRIYGATSLQVVRRLRAMLEHLMQVLPESRSAPLKEELRLLSLAVEANFTDPRERARALTGDYQGIGSETKTESDDESKAN